MLLPSTHNTCTRNKTLVREARPGEDRSFLAQKDSNMHTPCQQRHAQRVVWYMDSHMLA